MHLVEHQSVVTTNPARRPAAPQNVPENEPSEKPKAWSLLLDGARPWGSFDAMVGRYGVRRYRLVVSPPGATRTQRRADRLWRNWSLSGAVLGFLAVMLLSDTLASPTVVLTATIALYVGVGALLFVLAGSARVQVRTMSVLVFPGETNGSSAYAEWRALVKMLMRADQLLADGAISHAEYMAKWSKAYDRMAAAPSYSVTVVRGCVPTAPAPRSSAGVPGRPCTHSPTRR